MFFIVIKNITNLHKLCKYAYMQIFLLYFIVFILMYFIVFIGFCFCFLRRIYLWSVWDKLITMKEIIKIIIQSNNYNRSGVYMALDIYELHTRNLYKNCSFLWRSSNYRPLKSVLHVRPGWIIYQNMRETWEKKVMKFEHEIPIGLDARRKKTTGGGGAEKAPPPMGLGLSLSPSLLKITLFHHLIQICDLIKF